MEVFFISISQILIQKIKILLVQPNMSNFTARFVDCSEIAPAIGFFLHHKYAVQKYCIATPLLGIVNLQRNSKWGSQSTSAEWASLELFFPLILFLPQSNRECRSFILNQIFIVLSKHENISKMEYFKTICFTNVYAKWLISMQNHPFRLC